MEAGWTRVYSTGGGESRGATVGVLCPAPLCRFGRDRRTRSGGEHRNGYVEVAFFVSLPVPATRLLPSFLFHPFGCSIFMT